MILLYHCWAHIWRKESQDTIEMFIAALFTTAKLQSQPRCPSSEEWVKKLFSSYTMEYYSAIKKESGWN
jgi:hypothetical protein